MSSSPACAALARRRADHPDGLGFWAAKTITTLRRHRVRYSITVRLTKPVRQQIAAIPETCGCQKVRPRALSCQFVFCHARPG